MTPQRSKATFRPNLLRAWPIDASKEPPCDRCSDRAEALAGRLADRCEHVLAAQRRCHPVAGQEEELCAVDDHGVICTVCKSEACIIMPLPFASHNGSELALPYILFCEPQQQQSFSRALNNTIRFGTKQHPMCERLVFVITSGSPLVLQQRWSRDVCCLATTAWLPLVCAAAPPPIKFVCPTTLQQHASTFLQFLAFRWPSTIYVSCGRRSQHLAMETGKRRRTAGFIFVSRIDATECG